MLFLNLENNDEKTIIHQLKQNELDDDYYIIDGTLLRKKGKELNYLTGMVNTHVYSSMIKNIILEDSYDDVLTFNMILYILYYRVMFRASTILSDKELTEGVIIELSNLIKLMIDREHSTYRNKPAISDAIDEIRRLIKRERINNGIRPKLNLRR